MAFALVMAGCPNPGHKFKDFVARSPTIDAGAFDAGGMGIADISGTFLLAVSTTIAADRPLQFLATTVLTPNADGSATLDLSAQPLTVVGRMPVPPTIVANGVHVDASGTFVIPFGTQMVSGDANPISGSDITATITLIGVIASADRFCGRVEGRVTMPISVDLAGSTWGAIRTTPGATGAMLPMPDTSCVVSALDGGAGDGATDGGSRDGANGDGAATDAASDLSAGN